MKNYNFHTHTKRCGHAIGEDLEYIEKAIKAEYQVLGMSDHCPYKEISLPHQRMEWSDYPSYLHTFQKLKEEFKESIQLFIGFECESYENHLEQLKELRKYCDYMILGQHHFIFECKTYSYMTPLELKQMVDDMSYGIKENLFLYLAHPDYYLRDRPIWDEVAISTAHEICKLCKEYDLPLELNYNGITRKIVEGTIIDYPYMEFYKIAASYGNDVCIGMDAHYPDRLLEEEYLPNLYKIIDECHLNLLTKEDLIKRIRK